MQEVKYWNLSAYRGATGNDAPNLKIQYSADGTNWHDTFTEGDLYMRTSSDDGQTWSGAMQFVQDTADFNGTFPNLVAGDITPKSNTPSVYTHKYSAQSTGGDADIKNGDAFLDSIKGNLKNINGVLVPFLADTFVSTGMNQVNAENYLTIGGRKAYYFPVIAGAWGAYGTTEENNGYKIIATSTPYAVNFSQTKPTTSAYGTACAYHTHNSVNYYTPATQGWLVIIMPDDVVPACHLEWSGKYEEEGGTFANTTKSIGTAITAVHAWGLSGIVGADRSSFDEIDLVAGKGYARNDRSLLSALTWTKTVVTDNTDSEDPVTRYIYTATISAMAANGLWQCLYDGLVVEGNTLTIESTLISSVEDLVASFTANDMFYYEKASVTSSNISGASTLRANTVNDYGTSYFLNSNELVAVEAYVTEEFYQSGKDFIWNGITYTQGEMSEVIAAALAEHEEKLNGITESFRKGLPFLKVQQLLVARRLDMYLTEGNAVASGAGAPTILPQYNGQEYFDTTNKVWYKAAFTGVQPTAAAWKQITNA